MTQLASKTLGNPANPALMLLHGFMSSNAQWLLNIEALSQDYFLVLVELWGHGESSLPEDSSSFSIPAYILEFERIREEQGIDHWGLIGQSYGAGLMIHYALLEPQRCRAIVATNSRSAFGQLINQRDDQEQAGKQDSQNPPDFNPRNLPYHPVHARRFPAKVKEALVASADAISADAIQLGGKLGTDLNCIELLGRLQSPLLLTNGIYETSFQPELEYLRARYPALLSIDLEAGHSVNIEAANDFNQAVLSFLKNHHC
jgi:2-succinyl-6-hydroxy-2,4-cyclohexadiene-1-carboxylate synthase